MVIGDGLLLVPGRRMRLYAVAGGSARWLGTFSGALAAWRVIETLDSRAAND